MSGHDTLSGVYAIIHQPSGRAYVGSSRHIFKRWWHHANTLNHGRHHAADLQDLWLLSGPGAFVFVVLEQCAIEDLVLREQAWLDSFEAPLNASLNAACGQLDPRVAEKGAAKRRGQKRPPEVGQKIAAALRGQPLTEERKAKISAAHLAKPKTEKQLAHLERLHALVRSESRRYKFRDAMRQPENRALQLAHHWSKSPRAIEIGQRISASKIAKQVNVEAPN